MKIKKKKLFILSIFVLVIISPYIYFLSLDRYIQKPNGDIVSEDGVVYQFNGGLTSSFAGGELKSQKVIGRVEEVSFFKTFFVGPKIHKLKNYDEKDVIGLTQIMDQIGYKKK